MTTKIKENPYYVKVTVSGVEECVMISQMRIMDANRIIEPMERLSREEFCKVKKAIMKIVETV